MKRVEVLSYPVSIFLAGDHAKAIVAMEHYVQQHPFCVTITPTSYVHTSGTDAGIIIGLINYPRFPAEPRTIWWEAQKIGAYLREELGQQSYTIQAPDKTVWFSHRAEDTPSSEIARLGGVA
jgi:hypothetical protein